MGKTVQERLLIFQAYSGLKDREFGRFVGLSESFIATVKRGHDLNLNSLSKVLHTYPNLNLIWLITGKGNMLLSDQKRQFTDQPEVAVQEPEMRYLDKELQYISKINELEVEIKTLYKVIRQMTGDESPDKMSRDEIASFLNPAGRKK